MGPLQGCWSCRSHRDCPDILTMRPSHIIRLPTDMSHSSQALLADEVRQNRSKLVQRKPHDVEVVSLYMLNKDTGGTLNAISSGFTKRLPCKQQCRSSLGGGEEQGRLRL